MMRQLTALVLVLASALILAFSNVPDKRIGGIIFLCTGILLIFLTDKPAK